MSGSESPSKRAVLALKKEEGNDQCADCGQKGVAIYMHSFTALLYTPTGLVSIMLSMLMKNSIFFCKYVLLAFPVFFPLRVECFKLTVTFSVRK